MDLCIRERDGRLHLGLLVAKQEAEQQLKVALHNIVAELVPPQIFAEQAEHGILYIPVVAGMKEDVVRFLAAFLEQNLVKKANEQGIMVKQFKKDRIHILASDHHIYTNASFRHFH